MNILYITTWDVPGQQFNGVLLKEKLSELGHDAHLLLWKSVLNRREIYDPNLHVAHSSLLNRAMTKLESSLSFHALMPVDSKKFYRHSYYQEADHVHLQLPHTASWFSISNVIRMSKEKKVFWTMHDPWLMTGHCIYPLDCERWKIGCGQCPYPDIPFRINYDNTAAAWKIKEYILKRSNLHLIVASKWMHDLVKASPLLKRFPCTLIPFGIDFDVFQPLDKRICRESIGIPADANVIAFRNDKKNGFKGFDYIENALLEMAPKRETYLIPIGGYTKLEKLSEKYRIIQMGLVENPSLIATILNAADIFLSPSIAEAFGLMPVEAMACGTPVVVFEGTALPDVIRAPEGGMAVPYRNSSALRKAVELLLEDREIYQGYVHRGLEIVRKEYPLELYVQRHLALYSSQS